MTKNDEIQNLYARWRQPNSQFVDGGIVDEPTFKDSEVKLMFLLKEVNDPDSSEN